MVDVNDNLWVGSASHGLFAIHNNTLNGDFFEVSDLNNDPIVCWQVFEHNGQVFACTHEGLKELNNNKEQHNLETLSKDFDVNCAVSQSDFLLIGTAMNGILKIENNSIQSVYKNDNYKVSQFEGR